MAGITVRELVTKWGIDFDQKPLKQAEGNVKAIKKELKSTLKQMTLASAAAFGFAKFTADYGDATVKGAAALGLSTDAFQEWNYVAGLSNLGNEDLALGFSIMQEKAVQAARGGADASKAFRRLGIQVRDTATGKIKPADQLFQEVIGGIAGMRTQAERIEASKSFFGKGGRRFDALIKTGPAGIRKLRLEAHALGYVMDQESAQGAERFSDNLFRLKATATGVRNLIGNELIPELDELAMATIKWAIQNRQVIRQNVRGFMKGFIGVAKGAAPVLKGIASVIKGIVWLLGGAENATKILLGTWIAFKAIKIGTYLFAFMKNMAQLIVLVVRSRAFMTGLAVVVRGIGAAFSLAAAKVALLLAWLQDLYYFFTGRKSAFGEIFKAGKQIFGGGLVSNAKDLLGVGGPKFGVSAQRYGVTKNSVTTRAPITQNIHLPENVTAEEGKRIVREATLWALEQQMRETHRDLRPAME